MLRKAFISTLMLCTVFSAHAEDSEKCTLVYKPNINERHFVPVGKALTTAVKTCINDVLIIPFRQKAHAVTLDEGEYDAFYRDEKTLKFKTNTNEGGRIYSCILCDPISDVFFNIANPTTLCVTSALNVSSCAADKSLVYSFTKKNTVTDDLCVKSLVYLGINENTLRFKYRTCSSKDDLNSGDEIIYDLKYGKTIRMLDELYHVVRADNTGLYYNRLGSAKKTEQ